MTDQTKALIEKFSNTGDIHLLPSIILMLQEEDDVSNTIQFKNCFRQLRNLAAHEPNTIVVQMFSNDNLGNAKIVIVAQSIEMKGPIVLDIVQFTVWMFDMYLKTNNSSYLVFWKSLMRKLYVKDTENLPKWFYESGALKDSLSVSKFSGNLLSWFLNWQNKIWEVKKEPKIIASRDPYTVELYKSNPKIFWKMAIPSMMSIVMMLVRGEINPTNKDNINGFIQLFKEREGV